MLPPFFCSLLESVTIVPGIYIVNTGPAASHVMKLDKDSLLEPASQSSEPSVTPTFPNMSLVYTDLSLLALERKPRRRDCKRFRPDTNVRKSEGIQLKASHAAQ